MANIAVDDDKNPQVDFVWGGTLAPQPDAERDHTLDPDLGDHSIYTNGYSGFPEFTPEKVDNAPEQPQETVDVVEPDDERASTGTVKVKGEGKKLAETTVKHAAKEKIAEKQRSVDDQLGKNVVPHPLKDVETPENVDAGHVVTSPQLADPEKGLKLAPEQEKAKKAAEKDAQSPVNKTVVMTPEQAIKAREADGRPPQGDPSEPIPPVEKQDKTGQELVAEQHSLDNKPTELDPTTPQADVRPVDEPKVTTKVEKREDPKGRNRVTQEVTPGEVEVTAEEAPAPKEPMEAEIKEPVSTPAKPREEHEAEAKKPQPTKRAQPAKRVEAAKKAEHKVDPAPAVEPTKEEHAKLDKVEPKHV